MEVLRKKRRYLKRSLSRYFNEVLSITNPDHANTVSEYLRDTYKTFRETHEAMVMEADDEDFDELQNDFEDTSRTYEERLTTMQGLLNRSVTPSATTFNGEFKIPPLEMPIFRGNITEWPSFVDLFDSAVGSNPNLSGAQKLQYLKTSLKGSATNILKHLPTTDEAYEEAWALLRTRYENCREIINGHLERLDTFENVRDDDPMTLRRLIDCGNQCRNAIALTKQSAEDAVLGFMIKRKLDEETRRAWELSLTHDNIPGFDEMMSFLEKRARIFGKSQGEEAEKPSNTPRVSAPAGRPPKAACPACRGTHPIYQCETFKKLSLREKESMVRAMGLCYNCLGRNHIISSCSAKGCRRCNKRHHTYLHRDPAPAASHFNNAGSGAALLATARIGIADSHGNIQQARCLLDSGSAVSFITEDLVKNLGLKKQSANIVWSGVGDSSPGTADATVKIKGFSLVQQFSFTTTAVITKRITSNQPYANIQNSKQWNHIRGLRLADPHFDVSGPIDVLLGVNVFREILQSGLREDKPELPIAQKTSLGWILFGQVPDQDQRRLQSACLVVPSLEQQVQRFWEMEELSDEPILSEEEKACEEFFQKTYFRDIGGRYVVRLPFKPDYHVTTNRGLALQRFLSLERKFQKNPDYKNDYVAVINDYLSKGHLLLRTDTDVTNSSYLPHHAVLKAESTTTKLRVVFDASAKATNQPSLNDALMNGPKLQDDLFDILLRFRTHEIVFTADIEKMYRQIKLHHSDFNYHRIFWRESQDEPIQEFCLTTVTFGVKPAPYLATRVLKQLANDETINYPEAASILLKDFYIDDLLSGCDNINEAISLCQQLDQLLMAGGFQLKKWASNHPQVVEGIPEDRRAGASTEFNINEGEYLQTLGLKWNPTSDCFRYKVTEFTTGTPTKRKVLSDICRTFDPLGWLSPVTINGKLIMQEVGKKGVDWDEAVPPGLLTRWTSYRAEISALASIIVPRKVVSPTAANRVLCGFADASERAFAAVVYLRSTTMDGRTNVKLVAAKTRVAPSKMKTLPRLELEAALLLAKLIKRVSKNISCDQVMAWTDSTVTLAWIRGDPSRWQSYVAHRVAAIQELTNPEIWHHVSGKQNPADCASRGISSTDLINKDLWWTGPNFLSEPTLTKAETEPDPPQDEIDKETKSKFFATYHATLPNEWVDDLKGRFSSFSKLIRVTAFIRRFLDKCRRRPTEHQSYVSQKELRAAEDFWIGTLQERHFSQEKFALQTKRTFPASSPIRGLDPFLDPGGLLRVGGRLQNSPLGYDHKHPLLLPKKDVFTTLLIRHFHVLYCHAGAQLLLTNLRRRYWILSGRSAVQKVIMQCIQCHRLKATGLTQKMAHLPPSRVSPKPAFNTCGVDYAGPIILKSMTGRKGTHKGYIAVFVCFATRAIHLELVSSLTTQAFINALRRFVSRRGLCYTIYSDCGTNFVGANKELKQMLRMVQESSKQADIAQVLGSHGIDWRFNPPGAPHFGGLWEAGIKSVKTHLYRIIGKTTLNFEEMTTILTQIEACLNSRPLCELSNDYSDYEALTPGHFLIGQPLLAIPEPDLTDTADNRLARYQLCLKLVQTFWKRWSREYLTRLQNRPKWIIENQNLQIGQLVLIKDDNLPPLHWRMGRVIQLHPGPDGLTRVVSVRTATGCKRRPIVKIAPLPIPPDAATSTLGRGGDSN